MWLLILSVLGALLVSALCSLMEATLLSLRPGQIAEMSAQRPRIAGIWQRLADDIERPIAGILILNTAAHTIGASVAGAEFEFVVDDNGMGRARERLAQASPCALYAQNRLGEQRLGDLDAGGEGFFQFLDVGDDEDQIKLILNGMDGLDEAFSSLGILRAESLIQNQGAKLRA